MKTGQPVKWIEDWRENLTAGGHAREEDVMVEAALKQDGTILGLKVKMVVDAGAYG
jgi:carbon-monoxide dehydrogenase large subunit